MKSLLLICALTFGFLSLGHATSPTSYDPGPDPGGFPDIDTDELGNEIIKESPSELHNVDCLGNKAILTFKRSEQSDVAANLKGEGSLRTVLFVINGQSVKKDYVGQAGYNDPNRFSSGETYPLPNLDGCDVDIHYPADYLTKGLLRGEDTQPLRVRLLCPNRPAQIENFNCRT